MSVSSVNELLERAPERCGHAGRYARTRLERQHLVVVVTSFVDVRELRYEKSEVHGESSKIIETWGPRVATPVSAHTDLGDRTRGEERMRAFRQAKQIGGSVIARVRQE